MARIIDTNDPRYKKALSECGGGKYNGCYFYANEIVKNILPMIETDRPINVIGMECTGCEDGSIVFLHNNATPWKYSWLKDYKDLILICSSEWTALSVKYYGKTIVLPMSVDVDYVKQFRAKKKTKDTVFAGNRWVADMNDVTLLPNGKAIIKEQEVDRLEGLPREKLLKEMAKYKKVYAIDRVAIEAKVLGCELLELPNARYSVDDVGRVLDNKEAGKILRDKLKEIGG